MEVTVNRGSTVVAILRIKRSQKKNKRCNWKTRWVKSITSTKSLPYKWKVMLTPFTIDHPPIWPPHTHTPTPILSKNLHYPLLWLFKTPNPPTNKRGEGEVHTMSTKFWSFQHYHDLVCSCIFSCASIYFVDD